MNLLKWKRQLEEALLEAQACGEWDRADFINLRLDAIHETMEENEKLLVVGLLENAK
jgi:hypothetical protein